MFIALIKFILKLKLAQQINSKSNNITKCHFLAYKYV